MMQDHVTNRETSESEGFSLEELKALLRNYRTTIRLSMLAIAVGFVIVAIGAYLFLPAERSSSLSIRLTFRGADIGEYPNGTMFSGAEIVAPPILAKVYEQNGLQRFVSFPQFKESIFILQSSDALEALASAYRAKLADPKLAPIDRSRIEQEFQEKKRSLSKAEHSLVLVTHERLRKLPVTTRAKILTDIVSTWADATVHEKGVLLYDVPVMSSGVFADVTVTGDYLMAADLLRTKLEFIQRNINQLETLPGAKVLRTEKSKRSLSEIRARLNDLATYRIQPLIGMLVHDGITRDATKSTEFLRAATTFSDMKAREAQARVSAVRDSIENYVRQYQPQTTEPSVAGASSNSLMDASFLDRILELSVEDTDMKFRQKLVDEYRAEALQVVPLEAEARFYHDLQETFKPQRAATADEARAIEREIDSIVSDARSATDEVNEIYVSLSEDLNPSTALYGVDEPVIHRVERPVSVSMYALVGVLLMFISFPAIVIGCLIHFRFFGAEPRSAEAEVVSTRDVVEPAS